MVKFSLGSVLQQVVNDGSNKINGASVCCDDVTRQLAHVPAFIIGDANSHSDAHASPYVHEDEQ